MSNKNKQYQRTISTFIRNIYSPGFSYIMISFFNWNLSFYFAPFISQDDDGRSKYDNTKRIVTTIDYNGAALLYQIAMNIVNGLNSENEIKAVLPCKKETTLTFDYKPGQNNQMEASLAIERDGVIIPFVFKTHTISVREKGQMVTTVIQAGLSVFAKIIEAYLMGIGAERHLSKFPEDFDTLQDENQQTFYTTKNNGYGNNQSNDYQGNNHNSQGYSNQGNNGGYQQGNYGGYQKLNNSYDDGKGSYGNNSNYQNNSSNQ